MHRRHLQHIAIVAVLCAVPLLLHRVGDKRELVYQLAALAPYFCFAWVAFLAERMNQRPIVLSSLALAAAFAYATAAGPIRFAAALPVEMRARLLAFALPVTLVALRLVPAGWYRGARLALPLFLASGPLVIAHELVLRGKLNVPKPTWYLALLAIPLLVGRDRTRTIFRRYLVAAMVPVGYALHAHGAGWRWESAFGFLCAGLLLTYAVFHLFWQKAYVDELMGIANRRALNEKLVSLEGRFAVAMVDIDHFKQFNDTFGHEQGDNVLRFVAMQLAGSVPGEIYRYGGEEIAVLFENRDRAFAEEAMEKARRALAAREFHIRATRLFVRRDPNASAQRSRGGPSVNVRVTVSVGVAASDEAMPRPEDVIIAADSALYRAKQGGRNRVVAYEGEPPARPSTHRYH